MYQINNGFINTVICFTNLSCICYCHEHMKSKGMLTNCMHLAEQLYIVITGLVCPRH